MMTVSAVKVALQPESQSCPMETRDVFPSEGKRCARLADFGSPGMLSTAVWVD